MTLRMPRALRERVSEMRGEQRGSWMLTQAFRIAAWLVVAGLGWVFACLALGVSSDDTTPAAIVMGVVGWVLPLAVGFAFGRRVSSQLDYGPREAGLAAAGGMGLLIIANSLVGILRAGAGASALGLAQWSPVASALMQLVGLALTGGSGALGAWHWRQGVGRLAQQCLRGPRHVKSPSPAMGGRSPMGTSRLAVLWSGTVLLALGVGYGAGAHFGRGRAEQRTEQPAPPAPPVVQPPDDPLPQAVEDWGDEIGPKVYILRDDEPARTEGDPDLRRRLSRFLERPKVMAARMYAREGPGWPKGPTDVYLVWDPGDVRSQLHGIKWIGPPGNPSEAGIHRVFALHLGGCHGLVFVDVDGDGRREVITSSPGADQWTVAIVDLFAPDGAIRKDKGLPFTNDEWWKFADLDNDGVYEAITAGPAWDVENLERDGTNEQQVFAVYSFSEGEWALSTVQDADPTVGR